jgi:hypothetical protein
MSAVRSECSTPEGVTEGTSGERCPHCGAIKGGAAGAIDALYHEVQRLTELAGAREAELLREIRLLQETVARLRGGIVTLRRLDVLFPQLTTITHFHHERGRRCLSTATSTREVAWSGPHLQT